MSIDEEPSKVFTFFDGNLSIRIPVSWQGHDEGEWVWSCYDADNDTGTLWISIMQFRNVDNALELDEESATNREVLLSRLRENFAPDFPVADDQDKHCVKYHRDFIEDGESLRSHWTHGLMTADHDVFVVSFNLVLSVDQMLTQEFRSLLSRMDAEIERALGHVTRV